MAVPEDIRNAPEHAYDDVRHGDLRAAITAELTRIMAEAYWGVIATIREEITRFLQSELDQWLGGSELHVLNFLGGLCGALLEVGIVPQHSGECRRRR